MLIHPHVTTLLLALTVSQSANEPVDVRVGIVAYEDFHDEYAQFAGIFAEIARRDPQLHFRLAVGSYGHVLHWLDRQQIDVAILTPGVFAGLLRSHNDSWQLESCDYLATVQLPAARSPWASRARRSPGFFNSYQSVCLVGQASSIETREELCRRAGEGDVEFLFVHPLSVSGRAAPREALRRTGITLEGLPARFTYSHSQSLRMLVAPDAPKDRVAFVWDDAAGLNTQLADGVRQVPFPELADLSIAHDVVIARKGFSQASRVKEHLLAPARDKQRYRFVELEDWPARYGQIANWQTPVTRRGDAAEEGECVSLDEIGYLLLQYARSHPQPPRVALVLSGGGAKCSYQVGAVRAIEERLSQLRRENPQYPIDIDLVVGTSGGAINALPAAMGMTGTEAGQQALEETWLELNQCEIIRPPLAERVLMGLWFALLQTAIVLGLVRWFVQDANRRGWAFAAIYTLLAGIELLLGYFAPPPWQLLGTNHVLHHIWLWFSFGVKASAWFLFLIGLAALVLQAIRARRGDHIRLPRYFKRTVLASGLLGLPLLQVVTITTCEETLSLGSGMEEALASKFPRLINRYLESENQLGLEIEDGVSNHQRLRCASAQIIDRHLLRRDLVITGSCLDQTSQELPSDLYFYAAAERGMSVEAYGQRGVSLRSHPSILLDVVMGSGSIYPLFPARRVEGIPRRGEHIDLVDGGFAHNSPVEAAVLWGATHIVLIDVMARGSIQRGNFLQNAASSVQHLHRQAQLLDARSRERVNIFTLSPEPPHVCIIDFANNLIRQSIEQGYGDAQLGALTARPRFRKELGQPVFREVGQ